VVFVAIVWAVALSFIAFELVFLTGTDFLMARPALFGSLGLSAATRASQTCEVDPEPRPAATASAVSPAEARFGAWLIGLKVGRDALARQYSSVDRALLAQALQDAQKIAGMLSVPAPAIFVPQHTAGANTEFVAFIERDASQTARQLALMQSAEACYLYKLAAFWGYATLVRASLPGERALFAAEIRHYAQRAGLPATLWSPLIEPTPARASATAINQESEALTKGVSAHLGRSR
jgi:hypothetical protein